MSVKQADYSAEAAFLRALINVRSNLDACVR